MKRITGDEKIVDYIVSEWYCISYIGNRIFLLSVGVEMTDLITIVIVLTLMGLVGASILDWLDK